jgi:hypothetical protein
MGPAHKRRRLGRARALGFGEGAPTLGELGRGGGGGRCWAACVAVQGGGAGWSARGKGGAGPLYFLFIYFVFSLSFVLFENTF